MKKLVSMLLIAVMLCACAGVVSAEATAGGEKITITVSGGASNFGEKWNDTVMVQEIENRLGIVMDCHEEEEWAEKFTLMLSSDTLPDLIINAKLNLNDVADYGSQGYFYPMNTLIDEYAPNLKRYLEEYPSLRSYMTSPDGNIYCLVGFADNVIEQVPRVFVNQRWLDALNMELPSTVDEFYDMLVAFKTQDPNGNGEADEIPLAYGVSNFVENVLMSAFGIKNRENVYALQQKDGEVYLAETSENYKAFLSFMNKLYGEGLLDPNNFTVTEAVHNQQVIDNQVGVFAAWAPFVTTSSDISGDKNFAYLGALSSEYSPTADIVLSNQVNNLGLALINAESEYAPQIMQLLDYFYSDEGVMAAMRGWEGVTFDYISLPYEGLEQYPIATMRECEGYASPEEYRYKKAVINTGFLFVTSSLGTQYAAIEAATEEQLAQMLDEYGWAVLIARDALNNPNINLVENFPALIYSEEESAERNIYFTDISLYIESMKTQFITGTASLDKDWDTFLATLDQMQLPALLEIEQAAYDRLFK